MSEIIPKITIICLIYKSVKLLDAVYESALKYTPMLKTGEAEFLFVANDPTDAVIKHLVDKKYNFIINQNEHFREEELFKKGYGVPEYISRVYKGYNQGILNAKGDIIVLINSDNFFSPDWLENLLKYKSYDKVLSSQIVERNHEKFGVFPGAIEHYFGSCVENYEEENFINFVKSRKETGLKENGAYMPCLMYRDIALLAGLYPEGNVAVLKKEKISRYGDEFFYDKLNKLNVKHYTVKESLVYHLKEGEREEINTSSKVLSEEEKEVLLEKYQQKKYGDLTFNVKDSIVYNELCQKERTDNKQKKPFDFLKKIFFSKEKIGNKRILKILGIKFTYNKK